jgi:D-xylose transport system ATP-binding protein
MSAEQPVVALRGISKRYGSVEALSGVDLEILPGEIVALVGDNGAGKSTLAKVIAGAHEPTEGQVLVDGQPCTLSTPSDAKALGIETVYQGLGLLENLTVAGNIYLGRELRRLVGGRSTPFLDRGTMNRRAGEMLAEQGATRIPAGRPVGALSGGQRQMVAITRAAGWGSKLIIMDEPTAALGVQESLMVLKLMTRLRQRGVAVLVISHNMEHVFAVADRIAVLRRGRNAGTVRAADSSPDEVVRLIVGADAAVFAQVQEEVHGAERLSGS